MWGASQQTASRPCPKISRSIDVRRWLTEIDFEIEWLIKGTKWGGAFLITENIFKTRESRPAFWEYFGRLEIRRRMQYEEKDKDKIETKGGARARRWDEIAGDSHRNLTHRLNKIKKRKGELRDSKQEAKILFSRMRVNNIRERTRARAQTTVVRQRRNTQIVKARWDDRVSDDGASKWMTMICCWQEGRR